MPSLSGNITNRVRKLAKPSNAAQALQPVFEAVSNSFFAIDDRYGDWKRANGKVEVRVSNLSNHAEIEITIIDNGIGLDEKHFEAFLTVDTDFKFKKGGKGIGRLFWLDAFDEIYIETRFEEGDAQKLKAYQFALVPEDQLQEVAAESILPPYDRGTAVRFRGIRSKEYAQFFPRSREELRRYFNSHFIADFLLESCPAVLLDVDGDEAAYPESITDLVVGGAMVSGPFEAVPFGDLTVVGFACDPLASFGLDGRHQLHLLANGRTVETRKIDNLLGLPAVEAGERGDLVFHGCVSGEFLNLRVNEGRTGFNLSEADLKRISRACVDKVKDEFFSDQIIKYSKERREKYDSFVARHPIYGFDDPDTQLKRVPFHAMKPEDFAAGLVKYQIRREEDRQRTLNELLNLLEGGNALPTDFAATMVRAAEGIQASERLALAQHVVRRKLVLEIMDRLLTRSRAMKTGDDDYYLEETLHTLISPMRIRGDDPNEIESRAHDLWIVDERFAFTRAFSSDKRLGKVIKGSKSAKRPDLLLWDFAVGMGVTDPNVNEDHVDVSKPLDKVMIVEFKKPGREDYKESKDQIEQQVISYLAELQDGQIETFDKRKVRIAKDCIFFCYVVADIVGDLKHQLSGWDTVANGEGRIRPLRGQYAGFIEVVQWQDLVNDAWARNQGLLFAAGLKRGNPTEIVFEEPAAFGSVSGEEEDDL